MAARGFTYEDSERKMQKVWGVLARFRDRIVNYGNVTKGNRQQVTFEELQTVQSRLIHAVFADRETLQECLRDLAAADVGVSVVVSGLYDEVLDACEESGLTPHTVNLSLGIHGRTDRLPAPEVLEITTMCGHAMISAALVRKVLEDVEIGRSSAEEAARELSRLCVCGIFNPERAEAVLQKLVGPTRGSP
jgi:hypothetical protein